MKVVHTGLCGLSSHPPELLVILLLSVRTTVIVAPFWVSRGQRQQPGPPVHRCLPCRPTNYCGYQQGEPSPYLISRVLLEELDFRGLVSLAANDQDPSTPVHRSYPLSHPVTIPFAGTVGSPDFLPLRTTVVQDPRAAI